MSLRDRLATNLGEKNIPKTLVQAGAPTQLAALYWREEASSPPKTTVEVWMLADNKFIVVSGYWGSGEWTQDDLTYYDVQPTLDKALAFAKENFGFAPVDQDEVAKEQTEEQAPVQEQPAQTEEPAATEEKTDEKVAGSFKRLIKKN